jgi:hypothetical protein
MVQGSPLKVEVSLPMGPMVRASRLMAPVLMVLAQALASQPMAPVLTVLAQALASQPMVPVRALPGQASRQMVPEPVPPEQELAPASSQAHHRARQAMAAGCRSSSAGRR